MNKKGAQSDAVQVEEKYWTVQQVAELLQVSEDTIRRRFQDEPGVIALTRRRLTARGAPRVFLRIPDSILARFLRRNMIEPRKR